MHTNVCRIVVGEEAGTSKTVEDKRKKEICLFAGLLSSSVKVEAGTSKTVENEKSYLFAVPEGGWSTITVYVL